MHELRERLELAEYARRRVDVCDGDDLVALLLERLFDLVELRALANGRLQLRRLDAVRLEAVGKGIGEVARVQDKGFVAGLDEIGSDLVPTEGAGARNDKGLRGGVCGLEQFAQIGEDLAEDVDERLADVRFAVGGLLAACLR